MLNGTSYYFNCEGTILQEKRFTATTIEGSFDKIKTAVLNGWTVYLYNYTIPGAKTTPVPTMVLYDSETEMLYLRAYNLVGIAIDADDNWTNG